MDEREATERTGRLLTNVERAHELLQDAGDQRWEHWILAVRRELTAHDAHGLTRLLAGYGGMGSFGDLVLHPRNGHAVAEEDVEAVNAELTRLRSQMHDDARALLHQLQRDR